MHTPSTQMVICVVCNKHFTGTLSFALSICQYIFSFWDVHVHVNTKLSLWLCIIYMNRSICQLANVSAHIFVSLHCVKSQCAVGFYCFSATCWKPPDGNKGECSRARLLCSGKQSTWTELKKKTKGDNGGLGAGGWGGSSEQFQENSCAGCRKSRPREPNVQKRRAGTGDKKMFKGARIYFIRD